MNIAKNLKVCICHTDFRVYWPARLEAFHEYCHLRGGELVVLEIAGLGSPYSFSVPQRPAGIDWRCVYPDVRAERLNCYKASRAVVRRLAEINPDVVIAGALAYPSGVAAIRWGNLYGRGVVVMDNARRVDVPRGRLVNWVKSRIYQEVDALFLPAPSHVPDYKSWGVSEKVMHFGVNVVDNESFLDGVKVARLSEAEHRRRLKLPKRYLLGVGRQILQKNWMTLLEAWLGFKKRQPSSELNLVLVGNGPERSKLEDRIRSAGMKDVHLHDFVSQDEVVRYYALAEASILPSRGETWGVVVNEAMASGLPVIVSRQCGCASTLVRDGENGWLIDSQKVDSIEEAICGLECASKLQLAEMGAKSREIISEWGLNRFCEGAWAAAQQALAAPRRPFNLVNTTIVNLWNGRYRPT
ncbi:MAG: glycosyltransferase family 4 protein [Verrucomicrobia bacterium]|nr:glycosyltransferase family 4 protein [Verrucomicrobiota bacterium]